MRTRVALLVSVIFAVLAACTPADGPAESPPAPDAQPVTAVQVFLPDGDTARGRQAFRDLRCNACHAAAEEEMPPPVAPNPGPELGPALASQSRDQIATSIIVPSHIISEKAAEYTEGTVSPMGDYTNVMTIRQLIDIVAFLQAL